jgi:nicotinamide-nucleotide amidase
MGTHVPRLRPTVTQIKLHAAGLGEPQAERLLRPAMRKYPGARYTILAGPGLIDFIVSGDDGDGLVTRAAAYCRRLLGKDIYGEGDVTLAAALGARLRERGATAAAAESCTGGLASQLITEVPGSSAYFLGGAVTYSNAAKMKLLGVRPQTLTRHGAVSEECAREMASGARKLFGSDYAFSVTGIAGPDGGTDKKPVGLVHFGLAQKGNMAVFSRQFRSGRAHIRSCAANFILNELRKVIE